MKAEFLGVSDYNFTKGKIYKIVKFDDKTHRLFFTGKLDVLFINNNNKVCYIPYSNMNTFNKNWRVVNE